MYYTAEYSSPVGVLTLAARGDGLVGLWLAGQKYFGGTIAPALTQRGEAPVLTCAMGWLDRYFAGERPAYTELSLRPIGSGFRQRVWRVLCDIPYGQVTTYGEIAKKIAADTGGTSMSAQAVGGAVGHNPISIVIPCHRVVGADGGLTGYAGGVGVKKRLLELEGVDMSRPIKFSFHYKRDSGKIKGE